MVHVDSSLSRHFTCKLTLLIWEIKTRLDDYFANITLQISYRGLLLELVRNSSEEVTVDCKQQLQPYFHQLNCSSEWHWVLFALLACLCSPQTSIARLNFEVSSVEHLGQIFPVKIRFKIWLGGFRQLRINLRHSVNDFSGQTQYFWFAFDCV